MDDQEIIALLVRRVAAQKQLLAVYRTRGRPSEKLFRELEATRHADEICVRDKEQTGG